VKVALLVLAVSGGAPLLPRKLSGIGDSAYVFSLIVNSALLAVVLVPLWISLLAPYFEISMRVSPAVVALVIAKTFLVPLLAGMLLRHLAPVLCERIADPLLAIGGMVLSLAGVAVLILRRDMLLDIHWPGVLADFLLILVAVAIGHTLGGPDPEDRTALAIACATRHVGVAIVVATTFQGPRTLVLVAAYVVTCAIVSVPYLLWRRHRIGLR
jgi:BASS family bile acid:Na+ symporter